MKSRKFLGKLLSAILTLGVIFTATACNSGTETNNTTAAQNTAEAGGNSEAATTTPEPQAAQDPATKIGVLVSDTTSSEALGFRAYYKEYIEQNYNVEFMYSEEVVDAGAERSAIENFITNNCKAVISFASADRPAQLQQCEDAGVYYAVATGTLTDEQYETYKNYQYYVGAIGPNLFTEYQTGYDMAKYYADGSTTKFAIFGGGIPYYVDMHIYRTAGFLTALCEEESTSYGSVKTMGEIIGKIYADGTIKVEDFTSGKYALTAYHEVWDFGDAAWQSNMAELVATQPEVLLCAGTGFAVFGAAVSGTGIKIADIDSYTEENGAAMGEGIVDYLAGKFSSSIGPIFIATLNAVNGSPLRDADGNAIALSQGYWVARNADDFSKYMTADDIANPAYDKAILDKYAASESNTVDYAAFSEFVGKYSFDDISSLKA